MTDLAETGTRVPSATASTLLTFLIADIRGYTRFTSEHGDEAAARLAGTFAAISRESAATWGGRVLELRGDEALFVFHSARHALRAALDLQERFTREAEADPLLPLRVGIGLDAGEAVPVEGGYRGGALNLAARLCSLAKAGEIFATEGVTHLAGKIDGPAYVDRGMVRLKGLDDPLRVMQVVQDGSVRELPPLQPDAKPSTLPAQSTPFVGRHVEVETVTEMLGKPGVRLLTLIGPGGAGKTRLALRVAADLARESGRAVYFVALAPAGDPVPIAQSIAGALGAKEVAGQDVLDTVKAEIRDRPTLLVLDNFEHVMDEAGVVAEVIADCPDVQVLITSRIRLNLYAEHVYAVPPLSLPDPGKVTHPESVERYDAVAFFVARARAAHSNFRLRDDNFRAVLEICHRLDGLPLAIELAAARTRLLPPGTIAAQLQERGASLRILTGGARDLPARLQTLRGAIDWSYGLLETEEQALFARLSAFAGGCDLESAEAVCNPGGDLGLDVLEGMSSLIDKSLLRQDGDPGRAGPVNPRFSMLETIREYARERLSDSGMDADVRRRHAEHCLALAQRAEPHMRGRDADRWMGLLLAEQDNMRAALRWSLDAGDCTRALLTVCALEMFWTRRGAFREASAWVGEVVSQSACLSGAERGRAFCLAGRIAVVRGDDEGAARLLSRGLSEAEEAGAGVEQADALGWLGIHAARQARYDEARAYWERGLPLARELGDLRRRAWYLDNLGGAAKYQGQKDRASQLYAESLRTYTDIGDERGAAEVLQDMAYMRLGEGNLSAAHELLLETMRRLREPGDNYYLSGSLEGLACVAAGRGEMERAARLWGASEALSEETGAPLMQQRRALHDRYLSAILGQADPAVFAAAWQYGLTMPLDQAIDYAVEPDG